MSFQAVLKRLADKVDALSGAAVADGDGIIVESHLVDPALDIAALVAEYGVLWQSAGRASDASDIGTVLEMTVITERAALIVRKIRPGYFLLAVIKTEQQLGKGRFYARLAADRLVEALEE